MPGETHSHLFMGPNKKNEFLPFETFPSIFTNFMRYSIQTTVKNKISIIK